MASRHHQLCVSRQFSVVSDSARKPSTTWASGGICLCEYKHLQQTDAGHWRKLWLSMRLWCNGTSFPLLSYEMLCAWAAQCVMLLPRAASQLSPNMSTAPQVYHSLASASLLHGFSKQRMTLQSFPSASSMLVVVWYCLFLYNVSCIALEHHCSEASTTSVLACEELWHFCMLSSRHANMFIQFCTCLKFHYHRKSTTLQCINV